MPNPYACIPLDCIDHFCSEYETNPDTGEIRFTAPKTKGSPYPDYDEEASKTAGLLGRICDRVYPVGKSKALGEFGEDYDDFSDWDDTPDDPEYRKNGVGRDTQTDGQRVGKDQNKRAASGNGSEPTGNRGFMANESIQQSEQDWNRRSNVTNKRFAGSSARSDHANRGNFVSNHDDRRERTPVEEIESETPRYSRAPRERHRMVEFDRSANRREWHPTVVGEASRFEWLARREYAKRRRLEHELRIIRQYANQQRQQRRRRDDGFRRVRFERKRAATPGPRGDDSDESKYIVISDNESGSEQPHVSYAKGPKKSKRVVTEFEPPRGSTTAQQSDESEQSEQGSTPHEGSPISDVENFWQ
ncbi:Oidioi.mRNA.OKI2018_I69.chr1.g1462.t1.cds [Oikopleura dioica]|uniref:Oidioi.mRNA.OKI2018_I69.chr1.g1462.t1.cds n=1 Tax=Oikopleura dioica TaxID=34765 RepID=A0ABN7SS80_OIKDI|nr:Oidioi.mRNA.OKI2018_I69.chr1.g1462.t1.cds [Oikopleura dioica]